MGRREMAKKRQREKHKRMDNDTSNDNSPRYRTTYRDPRLTWDTWWACSRTAAPLYRYVYTCIRCIPHDIVYNVITCISAQSFLYMCTRRSTFTGILLSRYNMYMQELENFIFYAEAYLSCVCIICMYVWGQYLFRHRYMYMYMHVCCIYVHNIELKAFTVVMCNMHAYTHTHTPPLHTHTHT